MELLSSWNVNNQSEMSFKCKIHIRVGIYYRIKVFSTGWKAKYLIYIFYMVAQQVKCLPAMRRPGFHPWVGKITWRRKWQPIPVLLPRESHGQRSLVGYSPWGRKESDTTEWLHFHIFKIRMGNICIPVVDSFWYLAKLIQLCKV